MNLKSKLFQPTCSWLSNYCNFVLLVLMIVKLMRYLVHDLIGPKPTIYCGGKLIYFHCLQLGVAKRKQTLITALKAIFSCETPCCSLIFCKSTRLPFYRFTCIINRPEMFRELERKLVNPCTLPCDLQAFSRMTS